MGGVRISDFFEGVDENDDADDVMSQTAFKKIMSVRITALRELSMMTISDRM